MCTVTISGLKVLVVSRCPAFRAEMKAMLTATDSICATVYGADWSLRGAEELVEGAGKEIELVIVDIGSHDHHDDVPNLHSLQTGFGSLPLVAVTDESDGAVLPRVGELGVVALVPKGSDLMTYCAAITAGLAGGLYLQVGKPTGEARVASRDFETIGNDFGAGDDDPVSHLGGLTPRQKDVLSLVLQGKANKEISRALGLAPGTVKNHVAMILKRLNVRNRAHAVSVVTRKTAEGASPQGACVPA